MNIFGDIHHSSAVEKMFLPTTTLSSFPIWMNQIDWAKFWRIFHLIYMKFNGRRTPCTKVNELILYSIVIAL